MEKSRLLKEALEKAGPVLKGTEDIKRLLKVHKDRFRGDLQWILFCADLPSLIQEGPQCGLVALWMAGMLLASPSGTPLESLMQVAKDRGYTAQGEMFSVADMGRLAQEVLGCQAELLCGGLGGPNRDRVLQHLVAGHPLLIPYDEDSNHEPCQRKGHKAHWAVSAGQELALPAVGLQPAPGEQPAADGLLALAGCRWPNVCGARRRGARRPLWPGPAPQTTGPQSPARCGPEEPGHAGPGHRHHLRRLSPSVKQHRDWAGSLRPPAQKFLTRPPIHPVLPEPGHHPAPPKPVTISVEPADKVPLQGRLSSGIATCPPRCT
ncbi:UPF0692 protein C19orf54 homolog isoform X3 [Choloepus didactylus]|uniref:UPF0692 protein C19orf54 homolog isoform X3 n=1 Tax=Choloepus didactylus TaxID=27675 RepID=UPI00189EA99D|nr:UPF0692 protein C19orf54 homolog isoform X3 [Choloepus didactylus]